MIERGGRYLITQRRPDDHLGLLWEFPGGKREPSESWEACVVRELREELGVGVRVGPLLDAVTHEYPERTVALRFFRCTLAEGNPSPLHCHDFRWVPSASLGRFSFPPADRGLVEWLAAAASPSGSPSDASRCVTGAGSADVPSGTLLEEALARTGASVRHGCRAGYCGECAVTVARGASRLSAPTSAERACLETRGRAPKRRLACQARLLGGTVVLEESRRPD